MSKWPLHIGRFHSEVAVVLLVGRLAVTPPISHIVLDSLKLFVSRCQVCTVKLPNLDLFDGSPTYEMHEYG